MPATRAIGRPATRPVVHNVQILRFVAALGVALSHVADRLIPHDPAHRLFWAVPWTAGVDLFFVISGFIMLHLGHDRFGMPGAAGQFLKRRLIRIVPPYWFFTALTVVAVVAAGGRLKGTTVDPMQLATSLGFYPWPRADGRMVPILAQGWTLNYEAFFYLCFALALLHRRGARVLVAAFLLLAVLHPLLVAGTGPLSFWSRPIILEFLGGMAIARAHIAGWRLSRTGAFAVAGIALLGFAVSADLRWGAATRVVQFGIPALLLAAATILGGEPRRRGKLRRLIERGGDASYALYLAHYLVINAVALVWTRLGLGWPWAGVATGLACSIAVALVFHLAIERPVVGWLQCRITPSLPQHGRAPPVAASDPL